LDLNRLHLRYKDQTRRERTWTIHFISLFKVLKGTILVIVGFRLLTMLGSDVHQRALDFVTRHGIDSANRFVHATIEKLNGVGNTQLVEISTIAFFYSALVFTEGIGLWLQKRWAEYLTTVATSLLLPLEIYELFEKFTWVRVVILMLNIFIVWYLVTRLRDEKFEPIANDLERPDQPLIKICGITNLEDALLAVKHGADELGFNFYEQSPRYVSPEQARSIIEQLPADVSKIGVFVNESIDTIIETAAIVGLDGVQLHGDEDVVFVETIRKRSDLTVIKTLRVTPGFDPGHATGYEVDAIMLDGYSAKERGGTGDTFDWAIAKRVSSIVPALYLAGGLSAENVSEAVRTVRPFAVDACSRLESEPGKKDAKKMERFIIAVRNTL
jgi:phosphoribosylanthranilate isomerase